MFQRHRFFYFIFVIYSILNLPQAGVSAIYDGKHNSTTQTKHVAAFQGKRTSALVKKPSRAEMSAMKAAWQARNKNIISSTKKRPFPSGRKSEAASFRRRYLPYSLGAITVTTTADDGAFDPTTSDTTAAGAISLRSAIQYTNYVAGPDTIIVPAGLYTLSTMGVDEYNAATGDLNINDPLTIIGAGAGVTIIDGNFLDRVFGIDYYESGIQVTISDLTITNGQSENSENGGGIEIYDGTVFLDSVNVMVNSAAGNGGGIDLLMGSLYMSHGSLSYNQASSGDGGGANVYSGTAAFENVPIDSNLAGEGGGLENNVSGGGTIIADTCFFIGDFAGSSDGGAANSQAGILEIDNSSIRYCEALDVGGVAIYGGTAAITNSVIDSNYAAAYVGGVAIVPFAGGISLTMIGDTLIGNDAAGGTEEESMPLRSIFSPSEMGF